MVKGIGRDNFRSYDYRWTHQRKQETNGVSSTEESEKWTTGERAGLPTNSKTGERGDVGDGRTAEKGNNGAQSPRQGMGQNIDMSINELSNDSGRAVIGVHGNGWADVKSRMLEDLMKNGAGGRGKVY
ncbi:hypothetical protein Ancab_017008 [Ancistrocladus abbreviatus]